MDKKNKNIYIAKPSRGNQGSGILIVKKFKEIPKI